MTKLFTFNSGRQQGKCYITELAQKNLEVQKYLENQISQQKMQIRLIEPIITPKTGEILAEAKYELHKLEGLLKMLEVGNELQGKDEKSS